jgi:hypothetical protein
MVNQPKPPFFAVSFPARLGADDGAKDTMVGAAVGRDVFCRALRPESELEGNIGVLPFWMHKESFSLQKSPCAHRPAAAVVVE